MDEFAQTRGADDLFDDDFTPITEPVIQHAEPQFQNPHHGKQMKSAPQSRGNRAQESFLRQSKPNPTAPAFIPDAAANPESRDPAPNIQTEKADTSTVTDSEAAPIVSQQVASTPNVRNPSAVRGDRTATGGTPKPKLTEDELSVRLAAAKLNNAKRAEAHRLAEADEASFQQREAHVTQKRKEEGQAKRVMNMEREKNRLRKLGAQSGREWDEGKEDQDPKHDRGSQFRRGAHGGVALESGRGRGGTYAGYNNDFRNSDHKGDFENRRGGHRGRGRGDRGNRGRGGRGGFNPNADTEVQATPPDPVTDFPALPAASKPMKPSQGQFPDTPFSPTAGGSWADEVQAAKVSW